MERTPGEVLTGSGGSFDVLVPAGETRGEMVLHPDRILEIADLMAVGWEVLPGGRAGDHVRFRIHVARLVGPRTVVQVMEGVAEEGSFHDSAPRVIPHGSPLTVKAELLDGPRPLGAIVRLHVRTSG